MASDDFVVDTVTVPGEVPAVFLELSGRAEPGSATLLKDDAPIFILKDGQWVPGTTADLRAGADDVREHRPTICPKDAYFVVWRSRDVWHTQQLASDAFSGGDIDFNYHGGVTDPPREEATPRGVRVAMIAAPFSCGSGADMKNVLLFAFDGDAWRLGWSGAVGESVQFDGDGIDRILVSTYLWQERGIFEESHVGPHRSETQAWRRHDDRYALEKTTNIPSPYATLVDFMQFLSADDDVGATGLLTERSLLETAKEAGLVQKPSGGEWGLAGWEQGDALRILKAQAYEGWPRRGPPSTVLVRFLKRDGNWLISGISRE